MFNLKDVKPWVKKPKPTSRTTAFILGTVGYGIAFLMILTLVSPIMAITAGAVAMTPRIPGGAYAIGALCGLYALAYPAAHYFSRLYHATVRNWFLPLSAVANLVVMSLSGQVFAVVGAQAQTGFANEMMKLSKKIDPSTPPEQVLKDTALQKTIVDAVSSGLEQTYSSPLIYVPIASAFIFLLLVMAFLLNPLLLSVDTPSKEDAVELRRQCRKFGVKLRKPDVGQKILVAKAAANGTGFTLVYTVLKSGRGYYKRIWNDLSYVARDAARMTPKEARLVILMDGLPPSFMKGNGYRRMMISGITVTIVGSVKDLSKATSIWSKK